MTAMGDRIGTRVGLMEVRGEGGERGGKGLRGKRRTLLSPYYMPGSVFCTPPV